MDIIDFVFSVGAYIETPEGETLPVEAIVPHRTGTLVLLGHWWREGSVDPGVHVLSLPVAEDGDATAGYQIGDYRLVSAPTGDAASYLTTIRQAQLYERDDYVRAWDRFTQFAFETDEDFEDSRASEWFAAVTSVAARDALDDVAVAATETRPVLVVSAIGPGDAVAAAAAFDAAGRAATVPEGGPLEFAVSAFSVFEDSERPSLEDFAEWIREQRLYGPYAVSSVVLEDRSGSVEAIASKTSPVTI